MALEFAHGVIHWLAADALNTTYTVSGLPFQPKALRFVGHGLMSSVDANSQTLNQRASIGFATGTAARRCVAVGSLDAGTSSDCGSAALDNSVSATQNLGGTVNGRLDMNAINSDGFQLIVDDTASGDMTIHWEAWGGADITVADVGNFTEPTITGDVDYAVTGFVAGAVDQAVMFAGGQSVVAINGAAAVDSGLHVGFATSGVAADNVTLCGNAADAAATMITDGYCKTGECLSMMVIGGGNPGCRATLTQFGTDNFRLNWAAVQGLRNNIFMAIKGGRWKAGAYTIDGSTLGATATVSSLPFAPIGLLTIGRMSAEQSAGVSAANNRLGFGCGVSPTDRFAMGTLDEDGTAASEINHTIQYDQALAFPSTAGGLQSAYDLDAMNSDGFRMIVDVAGGVASEWQGYLAFGSTPAGGNIVPVLMRHFRARG